MNMKLKLTKGSKITNIENLIENKFLSNMQKTLIFIMHDNLNKIKL
jgi:hypothetical protein